jgi:hypothetical protein
MLPIVVVIEFLFCGYFINLEDIPDWLAFIEWPSPFKYAWAAMVMNEFETFDEDECDNPEKCDIDNLNLDLDLWTNIYVLMGLTVAFHCVAILSTYKLARKIRA